MIKFVVIALAMVVVSCSDPPPPSNSSLPFAQAMKKTGPLPPSNSPLPFAQAMKETGSIEIFSLLADTRKSQYDRPSMHGWPILGKTTLSKTASRNTIVSAFLQDVSPTGPDTELPRCFSPRHAIRVTYLNKTLDLVICFECRQVKFYQDGQSDTFTLFEVGRSPEDLFDSVLREAKVPLSREYEGK